ncbi:MAG: hypothetical protein WD595_05010 [Waddliaceae bacterium]
MKKLFTTLLFLICLQLGAETANFEHIPADTAFFSGGLEPFPLKEYMTRYNFNSGFSSPASDFINEQLKNDQLGIRDNGYLTLYNVGYSVVIRIPLQSEELFRRFLQKFEKEMQIVGTDQTLENLSYKSYPLENEIAIFVTSNAEVATIVLATPYSTQEELLIAFGIEKPAVSLTPQTLESIAEKYEFDRKAIGFVDHLQVFERFKTKQPTLEDEAIEKDIATLIALFPRTVFGSTMLDLGKGRVNSKVCLEFKEKKILDIFASLQGSFPKHLLDRSALITTGLGLDLNQLIPAYKELVSFIREMKFESALFSRDPEEMPAEMIQTVAMLDGFKGSSIAIFSSDPENMDAIFTVSTENPLQLAQVMSMMPMPIAINEIPEDGDSVEVQLDEKITGQYGIKGKHLVLYFGKESANIAEALKTESLNKEGFLFLNVTDVDHLSSLYPIDENMIHALRAIKSMEVSLSMGEHGLDFSSQTVLKQK